MYSVQPIQGLDSGLHLVGLGSLGTESLNEFLSLLDHLLLIFKGILLELHAEFLLLPVVGIVARIGRQGLIGHFYSGTDTVVQECLIVGHHNDCPLVIFQVVLHPLDGRKVKVVGGLIQHEQGGLF